jgi:hypothetical protein
MEMCGTVGDVDLSIRQPSSFKFDWGTESTNEAGKPLGMDLTAIDKV